MLSGSWLWWNNQRSHLFEENEKSALVPFTLPRFAPHREWFIYAKCVLKHHRIFKGPKVHPWHEPYTSPLIQKLKKNMISFVPGCKEPPESLRRLPVYYLKVNISMQLSIHQRRICFNLWVFPARLFIFDPPSSLTLNPDPENKAKASCIYVLYKRLVSFFLGWSTHRLTDTGRNGA